MLTDNQILLIAGRKLVDVYDEETIADGQHALSAELHFHLQGTVEQCPLQMVTPTVNVPLLSVLALVGERGGIRADRIYDLIVEAALEAHEKGEPVGDFIEHSKAALRVVKERVQARLAKVEKNGPLRRIVELSEISVMGASLTPAPPPPKKRKRA